MNLRELYQWALGVQLTGGVHTSLPQRHVITTKRTYTATLQASTRRASQAEAYPPLRRAQDVLIVVEACDSTSYLVPYLAAPDEVREDYWDAIPQALICLGCRVRRYPSKTRTRRCPRCGGPLEGFRDVIDRDEKDATSKLNQGGVRVA